MKTSRKISVLLVLTLMLSLLSGCSGIRKMKDVKITSVGVKYFVPTSMKSGEGILTLGIDNPAMDFTISDVEGVVRRGERPLGYLTAGELNLKARSSETYELPCTATLAEGVSIVEILTLASTKDLEGLAADINLRVTLQNGMGKTLSFNDLDLKNLAK